MQQCSNCAAARLWGKVRVLLALLAVHCFSARGPVQLLHAGVVSNHDHPGEACPFEEEQHTALVTFDENTCDFDNRNTNFRNRTSVPKSPDTNLELQPDCTNQDNEPVGRRSNVRESPLETLLRLLFQRCSSTPFRVCESPTMLPIRFAGNRP